MVSVAKRQDGRVVLDQRILDKFYKDHSFDLETSTLAVCHVGSHSHNTYIAPDDPNGIDDVDLVLIVQPDFYSSISLQKKKFESCTIQVDELDVVIHTLGKFCSLVISQNPNILNLLFLEPQFYLYTSDDFRDLVSMRDFMLSKNIARTFIGYASAQLYKMENLECKGYMGQKRKALVEKYGYDTKNAAHALRLLYTGAEALLTRSIRVYRPEEEANEYRRIKRGEYTLEEVKEAAKELLLYAQEAERLSKLPDYFPLWSESYLNTFYAATCAKLWQDDQAALLRMWSTSLGVV